MSAALVKYEAARLALAEALAVDEVQKIRNQAEAMRVYAQQAEDKSLEVDAAEIRLRAERRLGELIAAQKATVGLNQGARVAGAKPGANDGSSAVVSDDRRPTLAEAGISKDLSSRAQKIAAVPNDEFEAAVDDWRADVSAAGAKVRTRLEKAGSKHQKAPKPAPPDETAELRERLAEQATQFEETLAENIAMSKVVEADDKLAEAMAQIKQLTAENLKLRERINGLTNEATEAKRLAKFWKNKAEKAERAAA